MTRHEIGASVVLTVETRLGPARTECRVVGRTLGPDPRYDVAYPCTPPDGEQNVPANRLTETVPNCPPR